MPSKKRKYNARFPAGRIKKIMQTDEEVGKVAQAVPIIISRTLELFVESLLNKALQVTVSRNAKTLSPSHVKQCILNEARFDFLRELVKNIPDVSTAEEKEMVSGENSPNSIRYPETAPQRIAREDSTSSSSSDVRIVAAPPPTHKHIDTKPDATDTAEAIDLTKKHENPVRTANFYHETLPDEVEHRSVIKVNPIYAPQPGTSNANEKLRIPLPKTPDMFNIGIRPLNNNTSAPHAPVTPILNIDFSKNIANPEIKVLDTTIAGMVGVKEPRGRQPLNRQGSKQRQIEAKKIDLTPILTPVNIDHLNSGNLQIDEDYDT